LVDVHLRDLESGRTILVSRGAGGKGDGESAFAEINGGGTRVAFISLSTNLGDGDTDNRADAHLRDLAAETTPLVSAIPGGEKSNGFVARVWLVESGRGV